MNTSSSVFFSYQENSMIGRALSSVDCHGRSRNLGSRHSYPSRSLIVYRRRPTIYQTVSSPRDTHPRVCFLYVVRRRPHPRYDRPINGVGRYACISHRAERSPQSRFHGCLRRFHHCPRSGHRISSSVSLRDFTVDASRIIE